LRQHPIPAQPRREESHAAAAIDKAIDKLIHLALPVRLTHTRSAVPEFACTYDIHPHGARLASARDVRVGDLVTVERGRLKSVCRVMWTGDPNSELRGQFTVQCVEGGKMPWEDELRQMKEQYLPLIPAELHKMGRDEMRGGERDRRRRPRYQVEGGADVAEIGSSSRVEGRLEQISEFGCLISAGDLLAPGTALGLVLNMCDVSVAVRGHVRSNRGQRNMGVEFYEIRQGDRPLLDYVLALLKKPRPEDFADLEVTTEHVAAAER